MFVTVVICTWNRAKLLDLTLTEMRRLTVPPGLDWELLVVNNNCNDDTDEVIQKHAASLPVIRLFEPRAGKANACNLAIAHAKGDWILWTDDDVLVDIDWLVAFAGTATRYPDAVAIGGRIVPWFSSAPDPDLMAGFLGLRIGYCGLDLGPEERPVTGNPMFYGANMAVNSAKVKGLEFDTRFGPNERFKVGGDDLDYLKRAMTPGALAIWSPRMLVRHYVGPERMTLAYLRRWCNDHGIQEIHTDGVPTGARLLGVPRWLIRQCLEKYCVSLYCALRRGRPAYYRSLNDYWIAKGMVQACWKISREGNTL